jgi:hypothetical protein
MMAKRPEDRFQSGNEVAKELARYTEEAAGFDFTAPNLTQPYQYVDLAPPTSVGESRSNEVAAPTAASTTAPAGTGTRTVRPVAQSGQRTVRAIPGPPASPPPRTGPAQPVKPKPITKPTPDGTPSDSLPDAGVKRVDAGGDRGQTTPPGGQRTRRAGRRPPARRKANEFPVWALVGGGAAALVVIALVVVVVLNRAGGTPTRPSGGDPVKPAAAADTSPFRPIAGLLPDQAAAVLIATPKEYRDTEQRLDARPPHPVRRGTDILARTFRFDPWRFDRVVVAMRADPHQCVAVGEGEVLAKSDQFRRDLDLIPRFKADTDKDGVTVLRTRPAGPFAKVRAALLPPPAAYLIGSDTLDLAEAYRGGLSRKEPQGVDPRLLATAADSAHPPLLAFVAAGGWQPPLRGGNPGQPLVKEGVDLLALTARVDGKLFRLDLAVSGANEGRLRNYLAMDLPLYLESHVDGPTGKQLADGVRGAIESAETSDTADGGKRLAVTFTWDWQVVHDALEKVFPALLPLGLEK